jgi:hypothetical protein
MRWAFGIIDGILGIAMRPVFSYLFPSAHKQKERTAKQP